MNKLKSPHHSNSSRGFRIYSWLIVDLFYCIQSKCSCGIICTFWCVHFPRIANFEQTVKCLTAILTSTLNWSIENYCALICATQTYAMRVTDISYQEYSFDEWYTFCLLMNHFIFNCMPELGLSNKNSYRLLIAQILLHKLNKFLILLQLEHSKEYKSDTEERFRMKIFMENKNKIAQHNQLYEKGHVSYKLALNKYGDLLHHEFVAHMNGFNRSAQLR